MSRKKGKIVACLDIGTTKVACVIAIINNVEISVLGYGYKESKGIVAGAISDMKLAQRSITNAVYDAEKMAGFNIDRLVVSISGNQIISQKKEVSSKIASDMVKDSDIANLAKKIRKEYRKNNRQVIHLIPLQYRIDDSTPVHNPRYMSGNIISTKFHVISTSATTIKNIENCLNRCQLSVNNYISESYAAALSSLADNELSAGTLVIDVGGGSSYSVIIDNKLTNSGSVAIGSMHITRDIATVLNIDFDSAEKIKSLNSSLIISSVEKKEFIKFKVNNLSDESSIVRVTKLELRDIIESRLEEIFESIKSSLEKSGCSLHMVNNIVLTGGSASIIGIEKMVSSLYKRQVRVGYPQKIKDLPDELNTPLFCGTFGMLVFLQNISLKEKIKGSFKVDNSWFKRLINYLVSV